MQQHTEMRICGDQVTMPAVHKAAAVALSDNALRTKYLGYSRPGVAM